MSECNKTKHLEIAFNGDHRNDEFQKQVVLINKPMDKEFTEKIKGTERQKNCTICKRQRQNSCRYNTRCVSYTILCCLLIPCIPFLLYLIVKTLGNDSSNVSHKTSTLVYETPTSDAICLSTCKMTGDKNLFNVSVIKYKSVRSRVCCLKGHRHYQILTELFLTAHRRYQSNLDSGNITRNDIGTSGIVGLNGFYAEEHNLELNISKLSNTENYQRLPWEPCNKYRHYRRVPQKVTYNHRNLSFTVHEDGMYYLYSSLTLTQYGNASPMSMWEEKSHLIYRKRHPIDTGKLLMIRNYEFATSNRFFLSTDLGGAFYFREGDELYVKASSVERIYHAYILNRFGIFRIT